MSLKDTTHLEMFWKRQRKTLQRAPVIKLLASRTERKPDSILRLSACGDSRGSMKKNAYGKSKDKTSQFIEK